MALVASSASARSDSRMRSTDCTTPRARSARRCSSSAKLALVRDVAPCAVLWMATFNDSILL